MREAHQLRENWRVEERKGKRKEGGRILEATTGFTTQVSYDSDYLRAPCEAY